MKRTYDGAANGKGAVYAWDGNRNVGSGRMEILDAQAPSKIVIKLDFLTPFEGHNAAEFTMLPQGDATNVTWTMYGPAAFMSKLMQVFMNLDHMIGKDGRSRQSEDARRKITTPRSTRCRSIPIFPSTAIATPR